MQSRLGIKAREVKAMEDGERDFASPLPVYTLGTRIPTPINPLILSRRRLNSSWRWKGKDPWEKRWEIRILRRTRPLLGSDRRDRWVYTLSPWKPDTYIMCNTVNPRYFKIGLLDHETFGIHCISILRFLPFLHWTIFIWAVLSYGERPKTVFSVNRMYVQGALAPRTYNLSPNILFEAFLQLKTWPHSNLF